MTTNVVHMFASTPSERWLRPTAMFAQYGGRLIALNRVETVPGRANVALGNARREFGPWSVIARRPAPDRRSKSKAVSFHARIGDLGRVVGALHRA